MAATKQSFHQNHRSSYPFVLIGQAIGSFQRFRQSLFHSHFDSRYVFDCAKRPAEVGPKIVSSYWCSQILETPECPVFTLVCVSWLCQGQ